MVFLVANLRLVLCHSNDSYLFKVCRLTQALDMDIPYTIFMENMINFVRTVT